MSLGLAIYLAKARRANVHTGPDQHPRHARPRGCLVWLHLSSKANQAAATSLIAHYSEERDDVSFLITSQDDLAGFQVDDALMQPCILQYVPDDTPQQAAAFLKHWHPDMVIWFGSHLRPALVSEIKDTSIALIMIDAQKAAFTDTSKLLRPGMVTALLAQFDHILAADSTIGTKLQAQGARLDTVEVCGLIETGGAALYCDDRERDAVAMVLASRPVWMAANTDPEEDITAVMAHRSAIRLSHRLLLIIVPDNPDRAGALAEKLQSEGWHVARRTLDQEPDEYIQIFIADDPDEMGLWFRISPVSFLGNSLSETATGTSPFDASMLGSAVLYGPHVTQYSEAYERLNAAGAAKLVASSEALSQAVQTLLAPDKAAAMAHAGWEVSTSETEATDRTLELISEAVNPTTKHTEAV